MSEDSDQELSELDIETKTWSKVEKNMKLIGFRNGAIEGRNLSLQEGFNLGYLEGFKLGEFIGMTKVIINCESELELSSSKKFHFPEEAIGTLFSESCVLCLKDKNLKESLGGENSIKNVKDLISKQQNHSREIINILKKTDLRLFLDKG